MIDRMPRIAIVGAGVGGLTLWLALRQRGLSADIYEQASALTEIGAAVALSANGTRELERLGGARSNRRRFDRADRACLPRR
jgi:salicylate hydroxylase